LKAAPFEYAKPANLPDAISLKQTGGASARFLAGGQSLLAMMNMRVDRPTLLIDLNGLTELAGIRLDGDTVVIGALTRTADIGASDIVARHLPLLARCVEHIAHPAIRSQGTIGGSLALADPAAEWPAACLALDATMVAAGRAGERAIAAQDFFHGDYTTALADDELLVRIEVPAQANGIRAVALELTRRRGDFAIAGVLAQGMPGDDGSLDDPRVACFGIADRPVRLAAVEACLAARGRNGIEEAKHALAAGCSFVGDLYHTAETKQYLTGVLLTRAIDQLLSEGTGATAP
jgi:carbon-monoxide dehydrogenase medium subunit